MPDQNELINKLITANPQEKLELIENINPSELDNESFKVFISLIGEPDKGVRNCVTVLLTSYEDPRIPDYLVKYISSDDIATRNLAGEILVSIGDRSFLSLINYLKVVENYDDQKFIIDLLGLIKNQASEDLILEILRTSTNDNVKLSCIEALGNLKSVHAIDLAMKCYEEDEIFKATVNEALGKIGSQKALDFMVEKYPYEDELTKCSIIESLGVIGNMDTYFFLISELNGAIGPLTWIMIRSIQQLKDKFNMELPFDEKIRNIILSVIYDGQPEFKKAAVQLLNEFNDNEILTACLTTLGDDFELDEILYAHVLENKEHAILSFPKLLKMNLKNADSILKLVNDVIDSYPNPVATVLSGLHMRSFIDALSNYLTHPDEEIRRITMGLLFKVDPGSAVLFADKMISDDNMWNKLRLIDNIADLNDESAITILQKLSTDSEIMVSKRASDLLKEKSSIHQ